MGLAGLRLLQPPARVGRRGREQGWGWRCRALRLGGHSCAGGPGRL